MKITIHEEKNSHFTFHGKKKADHESRKYPLPPSSDLRCIHRFAPFILLTGFVLFVAFRSANSGPHGKSGKSFLKVLAFPFAPVGRANEILFEVNSFVFQNFVILALFLGAVCDFF